jgi:SAM-dependent methyltransferase
VGLRLNLGCGRSPLPGWVNVDLAPLPGIDVVADLDACRTTPLPFADGSVSNVRLIHVLEHIGDTLALMQELHRIAEPGATLLVHCPYGSSDDAFEDPTHKQRFFLSSFSYFGQPMYWRADYGYRGDWEVEKCMLVMPRAGNEGVPAQELIRRVNELRNVVTEMQVVMKAVKPIRAADRALQKALTIDITLA